jgi:hypothetical protein
LQPPIAFDVVSNGGEMDLPLGLGEPDPSHGTKMIAALPGPEDFFNSRPDRPQRAVMRFERFGGGQRWPLRISFDVPPAAMIAFSTDKAS